MIYVVDRLNRLRLALISIFTTITITNFPWN